MTAIIVRSGLAFTKGQHEDGVFGRSTWKMRYVELTADRVLRYYASQGGALMGQVELCHCFGLELMPLDYPYNKNRLTSVWRLAWRTTTGRRLVLAALSEKGMHLWATALQSVVGPSLSAQAPKGGPSLSRPVSLFRRLTQRKL
ncbi:Aste57867_20727 [Aphanomyces stellatus]|uniref:Aste57867_20727 protein n=1 Tax=Aphanomyces stellatus TaxID=120398 RepID=A0A485LHQ3_9STRA|nr:hypothetical protein As57867_020659 [Aphanomyces stellatus]VFT97407.1 Aste57867_20727 [Aphanomyces stellatus]